MTMGAKNAKGSRTWHRCPELPKRAPRKGIEGCDISKDVLLEVEFLSGDGTPVKRELYVGYSTLGDWSRYRWYTYRDGDGQPLDITNCYPGFQVIRWAYLADVIAALDGLEEDNG